jgi:Rieske Fe-S protein
MGCRLKPAQGGPGLRCLCHGSRFSPDGRVLAGLAPDPLPRIALRIEGGRVYARGTAEDI